MNFPYRQRGIGLAGWMILVLVFGIILTAGAKLLPLYMDHYAISKVFDQMAKEPGMADSNKKAILNAIDKKLRINQIRNFPLSENLTLEKTERGNKIILKYEVRVSLIQNIDLIASFDKEAELIY